MSGSAPSSHTSDDELTPSLSSVVGGEVIFFSHSSASRGPNTQREHPSVEVTTSVDSSTRADEIVENATFTLCAPRKISSVLSSSAFPAVKRSPSRHEKAASQSASRPIDQAGGGAGE